MSKKSNDSIEEFFKKGVRKSDITFRESDWQKMERMLDERAMVGSASTSRPLKRIVGLIVIVALLSSIYFLIPNGNEEHSLNENDVVVGRVKNQADQASNDQLHATVQNKTESEVQSQVQSQNAAPTQEATSVTDDQSSTRVAKSGSASNGVKQQSLTSNRNDQKDHESNRQQITNNHTVVANQTHAGKITGLKINNEQPVDNNIQTTSGSLPDAAINLHDDTRENSVRDQSKNTVAIVSTGEIKQAENSAPVNKQEPTLSTPGRSAHDEETRSSNVGSEKLPIVRSEKLPDVGSEKSSVELSSPNKIQHDDTSVGKDSAEIMIEEKKVVDPTVSESKTEDADKDETITPSRWSVAFVVAPEFSSTSMDKQTVPGSAYGLTIGYRIIDRLTISTGVIKTYKKYVGHGDDYQPPAGYWEFKTNGVVPDEVSGQCSVIEVPLMLQYDLIQRERSRLFASAGASSYRMLNEKYDYTFNEPNDGAASGWSTNSPSTYYFSVGHLSLGYDYRLYKGLHVGIEPYVKIPFGGIGWSNVNLLTMGAYVNVRYRFLKRN
jgi:hypothetical protein